jgi:putative two-component system response regulator
LLINLNPTSVESAISALSHLESCDLGSIGESAFEELPPILRGASGSQTVGLLIERSIKICQRAYAAGRSKDVLPISHEIRELAINHGNEELQIRATTASGLLSADTGDFATAINFHADVLTKIDFPERFEKSSRTWNNIGSAFWNAGHYQSAAKSYEIALHRLSHRTGANIGRFGALTNLAQCQHFLQDLTKGLEYSRLAMAELVGIGEGVDSADQILLHRNIVRLLVEGGEIARAKLHAATAVELSAKANTLRASIAAGTTVAIVDIACGRADLALTRLENSLAQARKIWPVLRDTLACLIRAEEVAGAPERALIRLRELTSLLADRSVGVVKNHTALVYHPEKFGGRSENSGAFLPTIQRRLVAQSAEPSKPRAWEVLSRLAIGNCVQFDSTGLHGRRVGALTRALATAAGVAPIDANEIGLAAELHDIGLSAGHENLINLHPSGIDVPRDILNEHCVAGWRALADDEHPRIFLAREIARYHHCWWNGSGAPHGVSGRAIPLHARMCAIADAYDGIIMSSQAGGEKESMASAMRRLRAGSGTQFDPELVSLFGEAITHHTRNEGFDINCPDGLANFHQLVRSLSTITI